MPDNLVEDLTKKAAESLDDPSRTRLVNATGGSQCRFELFQSSLSLCSQKVRTVLAYRGTPHLIHELNIICQRDAAGELHSAENYLPAYVRLRLLGGKELHTRFATSWSGVTSVATEGFDPCVVPTLVDHHSRRVLADSMRIIRHVADQDDATQRLLPKDPNTASRISDQLIIVDRTPHGLLLAGFHPDDDTRPDLLREIMIHYHVDKLVVLEKLIEQNGDDEALVAAYRSKIAKENVGEIVCHDDGAQRRARLDTQKILHRLDDDLNQSSTAWLCTPDVSLADLVWGVSLFRLKYLGLEKLWVGLPTVARYFEKLSQLPAVREGAIRPTLAFLPPSDHAPAGLLAQ